MARLIYSGQALKSLARLADFLLDSDPVSANATTSVTKDAILVLN